MEEKRSVLIVESNIELLRRITRGFDEAGYLVLKAVTGKGGRTILRKAQPDLIIVSCTLPDESCLKICQEIRESPNFASARILISVADESLLSMFSDSDLSMFDGMFNLKNTHWLDLVFSGSNP